MRSPETSHARRRTKGWEVPLVSSKNRLTIGDWIIRTKPLLHHRVYDARYRIGPGAGRCRNVKTQVDCPAACGSDLREILIKTPQIEPRGLRASVEWREFEYECFNSSKSLRKRDDVAADRLKMAAIYQSPDRIHAPSRDRRQLDQTRPEPRWHSGCLGVVRQGQGQGG